MIRVVKDVFVVNVDVQDRVPVRLPMVPSTGTYKETDEYTDSGLLRTIEFSCRLRERIPGLGGRLAMIVTFADSPKVKSYGTRDLPVRLKVEEDSLIKVSCKYKTTV